MEEPLVVDGSMMELSDVWPTIRSLFLALHTRIRTYGDRYRIKHGLYIPGGRGGYLTMPTGDALPIASICGLSYDRFVLLPNWTNSACTDRMPDRYTGIVKDVPAAVVSQAPHLLAFYTTPGDPPPVNEARRLLHSVLGQFPPFSTEEYVYRYGPAHLVIDDENFEDSALKLCMLETEKAMITVDCPVFDGRNLTKGRRLQLLADIYRLLEQLAAIPEDNRLAD